MVATLLVTGTGLTTASVVPYIKDIIRGKTKPRIVSWAIWTVLLGIAATVSFQERQMASAVLATSSAIACFTISLLALKHVEWGITRLERITMLGAAIGLVLWVVFDDPMLILASTITVDAIAYIPTFKNGWSNPHHESLMMFAISALGGGLVLLSAILDHASIHGIAYPLYSLVFAMIMSGILMWRRREQVRYT